MPTHPTGKPPPAVRPSSGGWDLPCLLHELAAPLQTALGLAEEATRAGMEPSDCHRLRRCLERLGGLCRAAAGAPSERELVDPWEAVGGLVEEFGDAHPDRRIILNPPPAVRREWRLDRLALTQTLANWVTNALRHAPGSEVRVRLRLGAARRELRLEVEDDGEGLAPEDRRRAFDPGWRAETSRARHPQGRGLGLSIVRHLATAAGGNVSVGSSRTGGCRFSLTLPATPGRATRGAKAHRADVGRARVAVIDDDATSSAVAVIGLRAEGAAAETLRPGRGLVRRILDGRWEVLLLDRRLGSTSGDRVARRLRAAGWAGGIVLWSGDGRPPPAGVDACLRKPASRREIAEAVALAAACAADRRAARRVLARELGAGAAALEAASVDPNRLRAVAHRLAGALGLAGHLWAARRAQAVERACERGWGEPPWRELIGDLRALAKGAGWKDATDKGPARP